MKLSKIRIKNFRGHIDTTVNISNLNVIIGPNDIGKSSIIDAFDIYFNDYPIDISDVNVFIPENTPKIVEISCSFIVDKNEAVTLDASENTATSLASEYLLNKDGFLEICKKYDFSTNKIKKSIQIITKHPSNFTPALILQKINDLKKLASDNNITPTNNNIKKDIRKAIFEQYPNLNWDNEFTIEVEAKENDITQIFNKFKDDFPTYMVFRADRTNTDKDKDKEVSETTNAITKSVVSELENEFNNIKNKITDQINTLAQKTLEKLKLFDENISNSLKSNIQTKQLSSLFSFTFDCDNGISFNKRGSGVKRLMLLSFFLADAEQKNTNKTLYTQ